MIIALLNSYLNKVKNILASNILPILYVVLDRCSNWF